MILELYEHVKNYAESDSHVNETNSNDTHNLQMDFIGDTV